MATDAQIAVGIVTRRRCPCCRAYWSWCTCNETQMEAAWERFADEHGLAEPFRRATQTGGPAVGGHIAAKDAPVVGEVVYGCDVPGHPNDHTHRHEASDTGGPK